MDFTFNLIGNRTMRHEAGDQDKDFGTGLQMVLTRGLVSSAAQAKENIGTIVIQKTPTTFIFISLSQF